MSINLSIIVPIYLGQKHVGGMLKSLLENTSQRFEFIPVFDGGGKIEEWIIERLVLGSNKCELFPIRTISRLGFPRAVNCGYHAIGNDTKYVAILNQDILVPKDWDKYLMDILNRYKNLACVDPMTGGHGIPMHPKQFIPALASCDVSKPETMNDINRVALKEVSNGVGYVVSRFSPFFCTMFNRKIFNLVGPIDDRLSNKKTAWGLGEDDDWCHRARKKGFLIGICKKVYVYHYWGSCFGEKLRSETTKSRLEYLAKSMEHGRISLSIFRSQMKKID